jgi:hypothetical protein
MRRCFVTITILLITFPIISQEKVNQFSIDIYGFIRNDFYYNSRQNMESAAGLFYFLPFDKDENALGEDLNAIPSSRMLSIASRFGLNITGPDVWGARTSAKIETDFAGFKDSPTMFRIRQAWVKLNWKKFDLLTGQAWHPMFGDVVPTVMSLATGSPFQPFNRSPQIRLDYKQNKFRIYLSALYQLQYSSVGPQGATPDYMVKGILPELYLGADYKNNGYIVGAGIDFMRIRPRTIGERQVTINEVESQIPVKVSDNISSLSFMAFGQYTNDKWQVKAKTIYGQNPSHLLLLGGYGVSGVEEDGSYNYTNLNNTTSWINIVYGTTYQVGLFAGYSKNLGSSEKLLSEKEIYVNGYNNLDQLIRIAPHISYNMKHWTFGVEYEMSNAAYGTLNLENGKVENSHAVTNNRIVGLIVYNF